MKKILFAIIMFLMIPINVQAQTVTNKGTSDLSQEQSMQVENLYDYMSNIKTKYEMRSEEHTSELQSRQYLVCRLLLEKKKKTKKSRSSTASGCTNSRTFTAKRRRRRAPEKHCRDVS